MRPEHARIRAHGKVTRLHDEAQSLALAPPRVFFGNFREQRVDVERLERRLDEPRFESCEMSSRVLEFSQICHSAIQTRNHGCVGVCLMSHVE